MSSNSTSEQSGFKLLKKQDIKEINGIGNFFEHIKTGAQLVFIETEDDNKVFSISFRTPASDNSGLPHILEHSVLCGSKKYPTKDPFIELARGSLKTYVNAMTFPDKTMYPVASRNEQDFFNLVDVYLDAVFNPLIYQRPEILKQEGWHYELEGQDKQISINGVVYNEMKGYFSSPDSLLFRNIQHALFPDTTYHYESGGDPRFIPQLTQEAFLDFHKTYYHPSNSYIFMYGDCDLSKCLEYLDREYLGGYTKKEIPSQIQMQPPFTETLDKTFYYSIDNTDNDREKAFLSYNFVTGTSLNAQTVLGLEILDMILLDNGAPLKKALLDAKIGKEIFGGYDSEMLQPLFSIVAKDAGLEDKERFISIIHDTLEKLVKEGIDQKRIDSSIHKKEFNLREQDNGSTPSGLIYNMEILTSWLYGGDPFLHLCFEEPLKKIKEEKKKGYFENLIKQYFLSNSHRGIITLEPQKGLNAIEEKRVLKKLDDKKKGMDETQIKNLINETALLKEKQKEPDKPEDIAKIPLLAKKDISTETERIPLEIEKDGAVTHLLHPLFTNSIVYLSVLFDASVVPAELLPYFSLLRHVLGKVDTKHYSYIDLDKEISLATGGIYFTIDDFIDNKNHTSFYPKFWAFGKSIVSNTDRMCELLNEIILNTTFTDTVRIKEIVNELKSRIERRLLSRGHGIASNRLGSYYSNYYAYNEQLRGIDFYYFINSLITDYEKNCGEIISKLEKVLKLLINKKGLIISIAAGTGEIKQIRPIINRMVEDIPEYDAVPQKYSFNLEVKNEGLIIPGQVQYVARGFNFRDAGYDYQGEYIVLKTILSYDYLWNKVRILGGAYGAFASFSRFGDVYFSSYRDPELTKTLDTINAVPEFIDDLDLPDRELLKNIIGSISALDTPLTPSMKADKGIAMYLTNISYEDIQKVRDQVLSTTVQKLKECSTLLREGLSHNYICVVGTEQMIKKNSEMFKDTSFLIK